MENIINCAVCGARWVSVEESLGHPCFEVSSEAQELAVRLMRYYGTKQAFTVEWLSAHEKSLVDEMTTHGLMLRIPGLEWVYCMADVSVVM